MPVCARTRVAVLAGEVTAVWLSAVGCGDTGSGDSSISDGVAGSATRGPSGSRSGAGGGTPVTGTDGPSSNPSGGSSAGAPSEGADTGSTDTGGFGPGGETGPGHAGAAETSGRGPGGTAGGTTTGGTSAAGADTGRAATGGSDTGGAATGGPDTGGAATGGPDTGGAGGIHAGGTSSGTGGRGAAGVGGALADCDIGCEPQRDCGEQQSMWECDASFDPASMLAGGCEDLMTGVPRYCCPAAFMAECLPRLVVDAAAYDVGTAIEPRWENPTDESIFLPGCTTVLIERQNGSGWDRLGPPAICVWEGIAVEVASGSTYTEPPVTLSEVGTYRFTGSYSFACTADVPLGEAACLRGPIPLASGVFVVN